MLSDNPAWDAVMRRRKLLIGTAALVLVIVIGALGAAWRVSDTLKSGALAVEHSPSDPDLLVAEVGEGRVTLRVTEETDLEYGAWLRDGLWGLEWDGGYARVGEILDLRQAEVVREFVAVAGQLRASQAVRLDSFAFKGDPDAALGLSYQDVTFTSRVGELDAWFLEGERDTWAIFTHGRGASREEALRTLPTVLGLEFPSLVITYRNDEGAPPSDDGFYHFGESEWEDVEAAVEYALAHGAANIILIGYSMGGATSVNFLYQSDLASTVRAAILDAPVLSFDDLIDFGGERKGIPGPLTWLGKKVSALRFDIDWGARDYLALASELNVPILLFHGDADRTVHIRTSDKLAKARPDIVTYVRVSRATHVRGWNMDPDAYEGAVANFLRESVP